MGCHLKDGLLDSAENSRILIGLEAMKYQLLLKLDHGVMQFEGFDWLSGHGI